MDQQFAQFEAAQIGPFKQSRSISIAPQLRFFFFRESFGLPQSPRQVLQWLLDPTLQLVRHAASLCLRVLMRFARQRTDSLEFRVELVTQNYLNFVFTDPPEDPQFSSSFILSKRRQLQSKAVDHTAASLDSPFPFKQAECVHTCMADDYRFVERHAQYPAAELPAQGAFTVPIFDVKLGSAPEAQLARRSALDIGPFTFPNLQSKGEKFEAAVMQLRTTVQNFLNLRLRSTLTPFSTVTAISRFGTQLQQRLNGKPVEIQSYGRLDEVLVSRAAVR